jgi:hypothetical protein
MWPVWLATGLAILVGGIAGLGIRGDAIRQREALYERIDREWAALSRDKERYL